MNKTLSLPLELRDLRFEVARHFQTEHVSFNMLVVLCGLPRAGKSTVARQLGIPMVEPDAIRLAFQGRPFIHETEEWIWSLTRLMVRSLFYANHRDVVTCGVYGSTLQRKQWRKNDIWYPIFCVLQTPVAECVARARSKLREDLIKLIPEMAETWKPPTLSEGPVVEIKV